MNLDDPLGLQAFTSYVFASLDNLWPIAAVGLFIILGVYGMMFRR